ncbi:hypothetical protein E0E54_13135 [Azotobacter chroococcum]|nr:hypothetical protein E0E54_13135 [Azotobacter chroococcum]
MELHSDGATVNERLGRQQVGFMDRFHFISGYCMNKAVQGRLDLLITVFAGLSAVAVIGAAVAMAPARKRAVAWCALAVGGAFAALLGFGSPEFHAAVSLGALACIGLSLRGRRRAVSRT